MLYNTSIGEKQYKYFINNLNSFPFSFIYDDIQYEGFDSKFFLIKNRGLIKGNRCETTTFVLQHSIELSLKLNVTYYYDYGIYEWVVYFFNNSNHDSKIISNAKSTLKFYGNFPILKGIHGDLKGSYSPYQYDLSQNDVNFSSSGGRPTHVHFPYFNLEYGNKGVLSAIGWAGSWKANFSFDKTTNITSYTAQSTINLNTYIKPREEIRTGLFVIANYEKRDENYATNFWRSWYINHNLPKFDNNGNDLTPFSTINFACDTGRPNSDGSISETSYTWRSTFEKMLKENIQIDFRWIDAGWYSAPNNETVPEQWWETVGAWKVDATKWPHNSLLHTTDYAREHNMKTLLWFEPERVTNVDDLYKYHHYNHDWAIGYLEGRKIIENNIGNPECFNWTLKRIIDVLNLNKIELFREDMNYDPFPLWELNDKNIGPNRSGITECLAVNAHYKLWDSIINFTKNHNGCAFVDSCASGGGRNDLESMRRAVPFLRSDSDRTSTSLRLAITSSLNKWLPFTGANTKEKKKQLDTSGSFDKYTFRASYLPIMNYEIQFTQDKNVNFDIIREGINEWKEINKYLLLDFYPLTQYHMPSDTSGFTAFAYHDKTDDSSIVFAFRMETCFDDVLELKLPFIDKHKRYYVYDFDTKEKQLYLGYDLIESFKINIQNKRESKLLKIYLQ